MVATPNESLKQSFWSTYTALEHEGMRSRVSTHKNKIPLLTFHFGRLNYLASNFILLEDLTWFTQSRVYPKMADEVGTPLITPSSLLVLFVTGKARVCKMREAVISNTPEGGSHRECHLSVACTTHISPSSRKAERSGTRRVGVLAEAAGWPNGVGISAVYKLASRSVFPYKRAICTSPSRGAVASHVLLAGMAFAAAAKAGTEWRRQDEIRDLPGQRNVSSGPLDSPQSRALYPE